MVVEGVMDLTCHMQGQGGSAEAEYGCGARRLIRQPGCGRHRPGQS